MTTPAMADNHAEKAMDLPPVTQDNNAELPDKTTHPLLRLTPDKSELIRLDQEAASIIIGNAAHINVIADSSKTLVVVPRIPGATHFTILGKKSQIIMQRHVIVASPKKDYLRIKRTCTGDNDACQNTSVFYCPDMCHEIASDNQNAQNGSGNDNAESANPDSPQNETPPGPAPSDGADQ